MQTLVGLFIFLVIVLSMGLQFSNIRTEGFKLKGKVNNNVKLKPKTKPQTTVETMINMNRFDDAPAYY